MRKHRLKNYLKFGILFFGIFLSIISCKQDDIEVQIEQDNSKYFLTRIQAYEFNKNLKLSEKISELKSKNKATNYQARYEDETFDLDLKQATYIESNDGSYHSYTFYIYNDEGNSNINNIVLSSTENGEYEADLVTYNLTEQERNQIDNGIEIDLIDNTNIEPFNINQINMYSRGGTCTELVYVGTEDCSCHSAHASGGCTHPTDIYEWQSVDCGGGGGSNGGSDSGSDGPGFDGSSGGGSSSGGGTSTPKPKATSLMNTNGTPTDCNNISAQINDQQFKDKIKLLKKKTGEQQETGFSQDTNGSFTPLSVTNNGHSLSIPFTSSMKGFLHTHIDDYENGEFDDEGNPKIIQPIKMFSPGDIITFLDLITNAKSNNISTLNVFGYVVSSYGTYTIRFNGNVSDITANISDLRTKLNDQTLNEKYKKLVNKFGRERGFLKFLKHEIGIQGINLYKIKNSGRIKPKTLNENERLQTGDC
ncbi:hypothetical protein N8009_02365 [Flavobacteriaceae bacterium]|nr:hypothetical protein [Flavobacteriaceae bacterium]